MKAKSFDELLQDEIEKLKSKQDKHKYYRCLECVHNPKDPESICVKCGFCGREFDDEGHLENVPEYPTYFYPPERRADDKRTENKTDTSKSVSKCISGSTCSSPEYQF